MDEYKKIVCPKKYFQNNDFKYEILNHLYFGPNFIFGGTALGRFSQCFFLDFLTYLQGSPPPPTIKTFPMALNSNGEFGLDETSTEYKVSIFFKCKNFI